MICGGKETQTTQIPRNYFTPVGRKKKIPGNTSSWKHWRKRGLYDGEPKEFSFSSDGGYYTRSTPLYNNLPRLHRTADQLFLAAAAAAARRVLRFAEKPGRD